MGKPYYYPIYEAAEEQGLAVLLHPNGQEGDWQGSVAIAGGVPNYHVERYSLNHELAVSNIGNLIFSGTLERFKTLKFIFLEYGWAWLGPLLWRFDAAWKAGRHSVPWVTQSPTDYVRQRIRLTSEPALEVPDAQLDRVFETIYADQTLLFSSDYPHWDADEPGFVFRKVDPQIRRRIFAENAIETFGERLGVQVPVAS
jgi:predicted TIM-barrel fold metal-dependent hydrolase